MTDNFQIITDDNLDAATSAGIVENAPVDFSNPNKISERYFDVTVFNKDNEEVESYGGIGQAQATRIRNAAHKEGLFVDATEEISVTAKGQEIVFHGHVEPIIPIGLHTPQELGTPVLAKSLQLRNQRRQESKKLVRKYNSKKITTPDSLSPLAKEVIAKYGFTVFRNDHGIFKGTRQGVIEFINKLLKEGVERNEISVLSHGTMKVARFGQPK